MNTVRDRLAIAIAAGATMYLGFATWLAVTYVTRTVAPFILPPAFAIQVLALVIWIFLPAMHRRYILVLGVLEVLAGIGSLGSPRSSGGPLPPGEVFIGAPLMFIGLLACGIGMIVAALVHSPRVDRPVES